MKVYAEYFVDKGIEYRTNTLLQFGDSWRLIGNVVLANPGSSTPSPAISDDENKKLECFWQQYRKNLANFEMKNWSRFEPDSTMRFIRNIFSGYYINEDIELNGIVQLFNTFNVKNQNLAEAIEQSKTWSDKLFSRGVESCFHDKPTYFGFTDAVLKNNNLRNVACEIFNNANELTKSVYHLNFDDNIFYHPFYVNTAYKRPDFDNYKTQVLRPFFEAVHIKSDVA